MPDITEIARELGELYGKATEGKWVAGDSYTDNKKNLVTNRWMSKSDPSRSYMAEAFVAKMCLRDADTEFCAAAHNHLPVLLSALSEQRQEIERLKKQGEIDARRADEWREIAAEFQSQQIAASAETAALTKRCEAADGDIERTCATCAFLSEKWDNVERATERCSKCWWTPHASWQWRGPQKGEIDAGR